MKKKLLVKLLGLIIVFAGSLSNALLVNGEEKQKQDVVAFEKKVSENHVLSAEEYQKVSELQAEYKSVFSALPDGSKFITLPLVSSTTGYSLGVFKSEQTQSIESVINFYRKLAGVEEIPYSSVSESVAQHASIGMAAVQKQSHYIYDNFTKPIGMTEEFWNEAGKGARYSNIHSSATEQTLEYHANSFIVDYGVNNKTVGHRRGILALTANSFGVGYAQSQELNPTGSNYFTALYLESTWSAYNKYTTNIVSHWPAKDIFPYEMYNENNPYTTDYYKDNPDESIKAKYEKNMRWSIFMHQNNQYLSSENIKVYLTDNDTGVTTEVVNDSIGGELTVTDVTSSSILNSGYDTIVFRPNNNFEVKKNTLYTVKVTGIERNGKTEEYQYDTRFVGMFDQYQTEKVSVTGVDVTPTISEILVGESQQLAATIQPEFATNKNVTWSSSNTSIAEVSQSGIVTAKAEGNAVITVLTDDGEKTAQAEINVLERYPSITKITITKPQKNIILLNSTLQLNVELEPTNANRNELTWESENSEVATVENGLVTGKKNGIVTINAKSTNDGSIIDSYQIVVTNKDNASYLPKNIGETINDTFDYGAATEYFSCNSGLKFSYTGSKGMYSMTAPEAGAYRISMNIDLDNPDSINYEREYGIYNELHEIFQKSPDGSLTQLNSIYHSVNIDYYTHSKGWVSNRKKLKYHPDDTVIELEKNETVYFQVYALSCIDDSTFWINNGKMNYSHGPYAGTKFDFTVSKE